MKIRYYFSKIFFTVRWNFSVGSYDISFMEALTNLHTHCDTHSKQQQLEIRMDVANGYVEAITEDTDSAVAWRFKCDSPIAAVWRFQHNNLIPVDIFRHGILRDTDDQKFAEDSILYLG